ncbi:hypothetical protein [Chitinibacter bivalviorum]|uniref:hypothetical protein n=1 Tax=Chitinibacter bivalviorum TaxID=2739434 RepID=UPI003F68CC26
MLQTLGEPIVSRIDLPVNNRLSKTYFLLPPGEAFKPNPEQSELQRNADALSTGQKKSATLFAVNVTLPLLAIDAPLFFKVINHHISRRIVGKTSKNKSTKRIHQHGGLIDK